MLLICQQGEPRVKGSHENHDFYGLLSNWNTADIFLVVVSLPPRAPGGDYQRLLGVKKKPLGKSEKYAFYDLLEAIT